MRPAVAADVEVVAGRTKDVADQAADLGFVVADQDAHRGSPAIPVAPPSC
jgi:hypothetical protein